MRNAKGHNLHVSKRGCHRQPDLLITPAMLRLSPILMTTTLLEVDHLDDFVAPDKLSFASATLRRELIRPEDTVSGIWTRQLFSFPAYLHYHSGLL
ncbi:uncharacterized protein CLUP02_07459 [Colletotrichum lupini]|uniref:Uncharacterized protein n=1 Tax=Colletotrichum lupini TaxID=145971 RepID=A0A9Q8SR82_9PEZI|nr:uncharacterized protein CLUP02_07459 [Colletotrichum lupini]UQC81973.1 hypothetical protein CLUP02_07459 [Colletotrichum lupini]